MSTPAVRLISECFVKPPQPQRSTEEESSHKVYYLTPWDISMLSAYYLRKGLLFRKPPHNHQQDDNLLDNLKRSLSLALSHFYPLAGRLVTQKSQDPPTYCVFVDCINTPGARFIHATLDMAVSDILSPTDVPPIVRSFFDHDRAVNHDGHTLPLLSIQVTQLIDGFFIGCSMNHSLADGVSYWNFFNAWSEIFQAVQVKGLDGDDVPIISSPPICDRWFPEGCGPLINLPFKHHEEFIGRYEAPKLRERIFHFSAESIAKLKVKANKEYSKISSFQSLSALVWRCITRARRIPCEQKTRCMLMIDNRRKMEPPLPQEYFGNLVNVVRGETTAGELLEHDLGWAAWKLHLGVANYNHGIVMDFLKKWLESPRIYQLGQIFDPYGVLIDSSPRFNVYGNEFGMGKALAVLSNYNGTFDGNVTSRPGREGGGSIDLLVHLSPDTMTALESDQEFMDAVSVSHPLD